MGAVFRVAAHVIYLLHSGFCCGIKKVTGTADVYPGGLFSIVGGKDNEGKVNGGINLIPVKDIIKRLADIMLEENKFIMPEGGRLNVQADDALNGVFLNQSFKQERAEIAGNAGNSDVFHFPDILYDWGGEGQKSKTLQFISTPR